MPRVSTEIPIPARQNGDDGSSVAPHADSTLPNSLGNHSLREENIHAKILYEQLGRQVALMVMSLANKDEMFASKADYIRKLEAELEHLRREMIALKQQMILPRVFTAKSDLVSPSSISSGSPWASYSKVGTAYSGRLDVHSAHEVPAPPLLHLQSLGESLNASPPSFDVIRASELSYRNLSLLQHGWISRRSNSSIGKRLRPSMASDTFSKYSEARPTASGSLVGPMLSALATSTATGATSAEACREPITPTIPAVTPTRTRSTLSPSFSLQEAKSGRTVQSSPQDGYRHRLMDVFSRLDQDGSGCIQLEELRHALRAMGSPPAHARRLMAMADRNKDGAVDRSEWEAIIDDLIAGRIASPAFDFVEDCLRLYDSRNGDLGDPPLPRIRNFCLISYRSTFRVMWDLMLTVVLAYIAVMTPYEIGLAGDDLSTIFKIFDVIVDVAFILDVVLNFRTTYIDRDGTYVTDSKRIAKHYLRTWFLLDFVSSIPLNYVSDDVSSSLQVAKIGKTGKLLRIGKIWRLTKVAQVVWVSHVFEAGQDFLAVSGIGTLVHMFAVLLGAALACHWLACFMMLSSTTGYLESYLDGTYLEGNPSRTSKYIAAQYWAVTTMTTVGYGDITPRSDGERAYAILAMFAGAAFYSYVIGYMAVVAGNRNLNERAYQHRLREVRAWLDHHAFNKNMRYRIWRYFRKHLKAKSVTENFSIIGDLSPELRQAVSFILVQEEVRINAIFADMPSVVIVVLASIIKKVVTDESEPIASFGDYGYAMCVITSGTAVIERNGVTVKSRQDAAALLSNHVDSQVLLPSDSFGEEIVLGLETQYAYSVVSATILQMAMIPADDFLRQFSCMPDVIQRMRQSFLGDA